MRLIKAFVTYVSPIFIISSPVTSYADQIYSIHRSRSSAGLSLDIPLIMLVASITKVFFWLGVHFDTSLLIQACLMILMQSILLHVALTNRVLSSSSKDLVTPFAGSSGGGFLENRPYGFWQWRARRPYWQFLAYFTLGLGALQVLIGSSTLYVNTIGYLALAVEAILPIPQILSNNRNRSCKGFRLSVLVNWLIGDVMKMTFFFLSDTTIPWAFKLCGLFQFGCDMYLGVQYANFGEGQQATAPWMTEKGLDT